MGISMRLINLKFQVSVQNSKTPDNGWMFWLGHTLASRWAAVHIRQGNWGPGRHRGWSGPRCWRLIRVAWTREEITLQEETHVQIRHRGPAHYSTELLAPGWQG